MIIQYFGEGCFKLQSGETALLVDPTNAKFKADVMLRTLLPTNFVPPEGGEIFFPGEYEIKGMEVAAYPVPGESTAKFIKTVFLVLWEEMRFVFLGHIAQSLPADVAEHLGESDVLFLPFDGEHFLSVDAAAKLVKQLDPHFVIPSFSKKPDALLRVLGQKAAPQEKFVFKKKDIAGDRGKVVLLSSH